jgi:multiple sugar transport system substrate-binding protein
MLITPISNFQSYASPSNESKEQVTLIAILEDQGDPKRRDALIQPAIDELKMRHPDLNIRINYTTFPYDQAKTQMISEISNQTKVDLVSLDQIWLGEFADKELITDLTDRVKNWDRISDFYESNMDGNIYNNRIYGIWAWTDVRGIWYLKDMLSQADVDPTSLRTWDGYIASAKKLNSILKA